MQQQTERSIQVNFVNWFKFEYPEYEKDIHHFANERKCTPMQGRALKKMGVTRGVSDIFIAVPYNHDHGLWIELKTVKGRVSKEQLDFISQKRMRGYEAKVAFGLDEAKQIVVNYFTADEPFR